MYRAASPTEFDCSTHDSVAVVRHSDRRLKSRVVNINEIHKIILNDHLCLLANLVEVNMQQLPQLCPGSV